MQNINFFQIRKIYSIYGNIGFSAVIYNKNNILRNIHMKQKVRLDAF